MHSARPCTKCDKPYIKPCDGKNAKCGNLLGLPGIATTKVEKAEGRKPRKGSGYQVGKDILTR